MFARALAGMIIIKLLTDECGNKCLIHLSCTWAHDWSDNRNPPEDGACTDGSHIFSHSLSKVGGVLLENSSNCRQWLAV